MLRLTADRLAKRFGRRLLFRDLSLEVEGGRSLAVTGSNGAGKSTLLRLLAGVLRPTAGRVRLCDGSTVFSDAQRPLHAGLVAPYLRVYEDFSARENLAFLARARNWRPAAAAADCIAAALSRVGLPERADDPVRDFSSGMKQRVKYAAALLFEPPLLLLDEPAANLDAAGLEMVESVVQEWHAADRLLVVATNRSDTADRCHDRLHVGDFAS